MCTRARWWPASSSARQGAGRPRRCAASAPCARTSRRCARGCSRAASPTSAWRGPASTGGPSTLLSRAPSPWSSAMPRTCATCPGASTTWADSGRFCSLFKDLDDSKVRGAKPVARVWFAFPGGGWSDSLGRMVPPADPDTLSPAELKALVGALLSQVTELERTVAAQREEIARLKGLKGRPPIKPSGMEQATEPKPPRGAQGRGRGKVEPRVAVEERVLHATVPPGSQFRGYQDFLVQDLVLRTEAVRYRRERWLTPEGRLIVAALPGGVDGHFGPELRRYVLAQYHQGQTTVPRLVAQLRGLGIAISKRQVMRLLIGDQQPFLDESQDVLRAGLQHASWITVDDTGARHRAENGSCTQIGNDHFAWFGSTASKSRLNFLELLRAGHGDYVVNAEALAYMRERALAGPVTARLEGHPQRVFADQAAWQAHLERLGIRGMEGSLGPARLATEGALWGAIKAHGLLPGTVIVSDDAGQFQ